MQASVSNSLNNTQEDWFNHVVAGFRADQLQLEAGVASRKKRELYDTMMSNDLVKIAQLTRQSMLKVMISNIIGDFLIGLDGRKPEKLAFAYNDSSLMTWIEIEQDNESMEDLIIVTEAKINAKYKQYGFHMDSMIVENSDNLEVPPHYSLLID